MTFVTADCCRSQLEKLTALLISAFPGSTIYQHMDILRVPNDVLNNKVDAVLLDADTVKSKGASLVQMLRRSRPELPVFILSHSDPVCPADAPEAEPCFLLPGREQQFLDAIRAATTLRRSALN